MDRKPQRDSEITGPQDICAVAECLETSLHGLGLLQSSAQAMAIEPSARDHHQSHGMRQQQTPRRQHHDHRAAPPPSGHLPGGDAYSGTEPIPRRERPAACGAADAAAAPRTTVVVACVSQWRDGHVAPAAAHATPTRRAARARTSVPKYDVQYQYPYPHGRIARSLIDVTHADVPQRTHRWGLSSITKSARADTDTDSRISPRSTPRAVARTSGRGAPFV
ncbi:hypothetical protein BOTBODRAFT_208806 [Botryobasidium botryosum FD-172 SS1]|uniref:Uncharacterized protein n=1 Tax=Botryobasidium botryosum (strain FD-172 SS1) TaxID=930990 RepID=A0A067N0T8_BOTB1|nr:hypothetical protein BOTBODRAFT_208806 [Botryobasidium botryosum FD-172 SS1]